MTKRFVDYRIHVFRISVDLKELAAEVTHNIWRDVENGDGRINLLVTVTATTRGDSPSNLINWEQDLDKLQSQWVERYVSFRSLCYLDFWVGIHQSMPEVMPEIMTKGPSTLAFFASVSPSAMAPLPNSFLCFSRAIT
jgi:hypothetical protein